MKTPQHYLNNTEFLAALVAHKKAREDARAQGLPDPPLTEYIGECFLKIATRLSYKMNFASYTFREDMVSEAVENCLVYCNNFDPEKSSNPFGYFTQVIYYAFIRRIQREKRHTYVRFKAIEQAMLRGELPVALGNEVLKFENVQEFIHKFDNYTNERRARRAKAKKLPSER